MSCKDVVELYEYFFDVFLVIFGELLIVPFEVLEECFSFLFAVVWVEFLDFIQFFDFSENSVLDRGVGSMVSGVVWCGKVLIVRWFFVQDGTVIFKEREAKYWACQSFGHDKCFLKIPVSDFELEDDCFGGRFNVAICDLEFERGWFQLFNYVFGGHLEDFFVIGFGDAVYKGARVNEGVQGEVLEVHGGEEYFFFFLKDTAEKIGMHSSFVMGSLVRYSAIWARGEDWGSSWGGVSFTTPVGDPDCVLVAAGLRGRPTGERGGIVDFSDWTFVVPLIFCSLLREVGLGNVLLRCAVCGT